MRARVVDITSIRREDVVARASLPVMSGVVVLCHVCLNGAVEDVGYCCATLLDPLASTTGAEGDEEDEEGEEGKTTKDAADDGASGLLGWWWCVRIVAC